MMTIQPATLKKLDSKTVRMAGFGSASKTQKSTQSNVDPYEHKTVDEIEAEIDTALNKMAQLQSLMNVMKN